MTQPMGELSIRATNSLDGLKMGGRSRTVGEPRGALIAPRPEGCRHRRSSGFGLVQIGEVGWFRWLERRYDHVSFVGKWKPRVPLADRLHALVAQTFDVYDVGDGNREFVPGSRRRRIVLIF